MNLSTPVLIRSHDKVKPLYLNYDNACDHQTWQNGDLSLMASTFKATLLISHMALKDQKRFVSTITMPMVTNLAGR